MPNGSVATTVTTWVNRVAVQEKKDGLKLLLLLLLILTWKQKAAQVIPIVISTTGVIPKSLSQSLTRLNLHPNAYIQLQKFCNSWHMFNCKKLFKLQIRLPSLILLVTASQDR